MASGSFQPADACCPFCTCLCCRSMPALAPAAALQAPVPPWSPFPCAGYIRPKAYCAFRCSIWQPPQTGRFLSS
ncbi:hypothetical protein B0A63_08595 [Flavobacterium johnsoniae UW101]|nr:hypothetical protein B0A63_08595 [Flavobacterium johnsoniae UW101]